MKMNCLDERARWGNFRYENKTQSCFKATRCNREQPLVKNYDEENIINSSTSQALMTVLLVQALSTRHLLFTTSPSCLLITILCDYSINNKLFIKILMLTLFCCKWKLLEREL